MGRRMAHQSRPVSLSIEMKITRRRIILHAIIALPQATSRRVAEKKGSGTDPASGPAPYTLRRQFLVPSAVPPPEPSKSALSYFTFSPDVVLASRNSGVPSASTSKKIRTNPFAKNSMTTNANLPQTPAVANPNPFSLPPMQQGIPSRQPGRLDSVSVPPKSALKGKPGKTRKPKA